MEMLGRTNITTVAGTSLAWTEIGQGPPIVLLHGMGDSHRTWRNVAPLLARRHRVLMLDLPGHGFSSRPDAPYTLDWYARTVLGWFDAVGLDTAHVVGHSFGGGVAQWMLLFARERVERLALVAAGGLGTEVTAGLRFVSLPALSPKLVQPFMGLGTRAILRLASHNPTPSDMREIARAAWMNTAPGSGLAFQRTVSGCIDLFGQHVQTWDRIDQVASLPPIGLFWGECDRILPIKQAYAARERIVGATFATYADVGHFPQLEATQFGNDLLSFFDASISRPEARLVHPTKVIVRPRFRRRFTARVLQALRNFIGRISRPKLQERPEVTDVPPEAKGLLALPPATTARTESSPGASV